MVSRCYPLSYFPVWVVVCLLFTLVGITPALSSAQSQMVTRVQDGTTLELNKPIERELKGGETHYYELPVKAGEYAGLIVDQRGIDVLVRLQAPDGAIVAEVDSPNGSQGPEPITVIIEAAGLYRLSVSALEQGAKAGRYEAKLVDRHLATQADRHRLAAEKALAEGLALYNEGSRQALERSLKKYEEALELYAAAGARKEQITALTNASGVAQRIGALDKALEYAKRALQAAELLGDKRSQADAVRLMSAVHRSSGDYEQELRSSERSLLLYQEAGDRDSEAYMLKAIAGAFSYLGEQEKARSYYERSLKIYQALGNKNGEATTFRSIGYSYILDDRIREGIDSFTKALAIWHFYEATKQEAIDHSFIANEYARLGERQQALENADKALRLRGVNGDFNEGTILTNVGHAFNKLHEFEKALNCYKEALKIWQDLRDKRGEAITLKHTAAVYRDQGRLAEALTTIERSIALVEFSRDRAGSPELRASFVASLFEYYEFYIDLKMRLHEAAPDAGNDLAALGFVEKVKMRSLVELLARARVDLTEGVDPKHRGRVLTVNNAITDKLDELARLSKGKFTEAEKRSVELDIEKLKSGLERLQAEIVASSPHSAAITSPQPLNVKDIQQRVLDDDTILLEYKLGEERSYLWAVTQDGVRSYRLPPAAEITGQVRRVYELLTARKTSPGATGDAKYRAEANKLSNMLIAPVASQIGTKRLLIVADGALQYLPFAILPVPSTNEKTDSHPLVLDHEIVSLPSASVIDVLRRELGKRPPAPRMAAVLADPVYAADDARVKQRTSGVRAGDSRPNFQRLLFSRQEAKTILAVAPMQSNLMALDFETDRKLATSAELGKYRIIHFSTHGVFDSRRPELSGLVLSQVKKNGEPQEGLMRLHEIYNLKLNADLVVLSACQTGLGKEMRGEGLIGLTRGFMYAGAPRVMASLWQVDDAATAALMKSFYRGVLVQKLTPAAALRAAQIEMLKRKGWASPYYWGAFVLQGEWR